jgi:NhaA family Na+:H+ antiporter
VYYLYVSASGQEILRAGLPAATAVDLAFAYFVIQAIFHRHAVVPFLLLLAFATNLVGFLTMGSQHTWVDVRPGGAALMAAALVLAYILRRLHVRSFWPYLFAAGTLSWWGLYLDGLHPALALLPVVPFLPHAPRRGDVLADVPHGHHDSPSRFEHGWTYAVQGVLLLFALVNAGVVFARYGAGTWALLSASLVGRPFGILAAVVVATKLGLHLPARLDWRDVIVAACAASIGFTMTMFFATSTYPFGPVLSQLKLGALATGSGVLLAIGAAWLLGVGRFAPDRREHHKYVPDVIL